MNERSERLSVRKVIKFFAFSSIGIISFLLPVSYNGQSGTVVSLLSSYIGQELSPVMNILVIGIMAFSAFGSLFAYIMNKLNRPYPEWIHKYFSTGTVYIASKFLSLAFTIMCAFQIGSQKLNAVAQSMVDLGGTLVSLALALSFLLVFLTDGGMMEFVAEITRPVMRPMFKVPSDASLDLLASWLGSSDAAVILTQQKYRKGYYSKRETAQVMCNFSLVSVPFCMTIAQIGGVEQYFGQMYLLLCLLGILLGMILCRIYPINRIEDVYIAERAAITEKQTSSNIFMRGLQAGCAAVDKFSIKTIWNSGMNTVLSVMLGIMPVAIGWGVIGMIVIEFTPIFNWISVPMGFVLDVLGVPHAYEVAPATLVGFIDMYIPSLLIIGIESVKTRFIIVTLSLIQIVYITIVGATVLQSQVGLNVEDLVIIFLERTIIALPIIVLITNLMIA